MSAPKFDSAPTAEELAAKRKRLAPTFDNDVWLRIYRAISWTGRAESESYDDLDAKFIYYWIAFNAAYGREIQGRRPSDDRELEKDVFMAFFRRVALVDSRNKLRRYVFARVPNIMESLVANRFVFQDFWDFHNKRGPSDWRARLDASVDEMRMDIEHGDTVQILKTVFERLYVLRNQLMHGGATWNSRVNREQLDDAVDIMGYAIPVFIDLMMDKPHVFEEGVPHYPLVEDPLGLNP